MTVGVFPDGRGNLKGQIMDVEAYLRDAGVAYEKHKHPVAYSSQALAAEEHVSGHHVAKPVLVHAGDRCVMCVLAASHRLDMTKLARALKVRQCRLANEAELAATFPDVEVGAEPPFGKPYGLDTFVDEHLAASEQITFTAGSHQQAIRMQYADYIRLAEATVLDISAHG